MTFAETLTALPTAGTNGVGTGLTISLVKALTHASFIWAADEQEIANLDKIAEINAIAEHLSEQNLIHPKFGSDKLEQTLVLLHGLGKALAEEAPIWNNKTLQENIGSLVNRIISLCQLIDYELAGITEAKTGDKL